MIIAIDFDGTLVEHEYPGIGNDVPKGFDTAIELQKQGHKIILWTVRIGDKLKDAYDMCVLRELELWGVNENPEQKFWNGSPKAYAEMYIDDAALGCPLVRHDYKRSYVDWYKVRLLLKKRGILI